MKLQPFTDTIKSHCERVDFIYIIEKGGKTEKLEHGISYGICVEAERLGVPLKELIKERMAPNLEDIKIKYWC